MNRMCNGAAADPRRVLVVEDQFLVALDMVEQLEAQGYVVVGPARSLGEALLLVECSGIDAGLLDVNLGASASYPVAEALMERGIPFAFLSGHNSNDLKPGFRDHPLITKPVHPDKLREMLQSLVGQDCRLPQRPPS